MSMNDGKQERKYHEFLGKKYRVDALPCGIAIPFNVELRKLRDMALNTVYKLDPTTPSDKIFIALHKYYTDNPAEGQLQVLQMTRALSVVTEFMTDGEVTESMIQKQASPEEVKSFMDALQEPEEVAQGKKLKELQRKSLL